MGPEILITIVVGVILLALVVKFWRIVLALGALGAGAVVFLCLSGQVCPIDDPGGGGNGGGGDAVQPLPPHVIRAAHGHLSGKTYTAYENTYRSVRMPCSPVECSTDWPVGHPSRRCLGSGGLGGCGYKTLQRPEQRAVQRPCPTPPPVSSPAWHVQQTGDSEWLVSNHQGRWTVIHQNDWNFVIHPHQDC